LGTKTIGKAPVIAARTRPKLIGGARAEYPETR
ncbi:MAG TPA: TIGR01440 family protein, partial [Clostridiales bacterium]|nr:TIGR01440 family protein [Clostridiales bacterium]